MDLIVALSACPMGMYKLTKIFLLMINWWIFVGDVSTAIEEDVPEDKCYPLGVEIFRKHQHYY
jgi:uncharacterized protein YcgI (DUF1989 family)